MYDHNDGHSNEKSLKKIRVLIVEDSGDDVALLVRQLRQSGYDTAFEWVDTAESLKEALRDKCWDLVLSDHVLPGFDGLSALKILQESGMDVPFILVSGKIGEETAVEIMKAGAHDCIMKDKLVRLVPAIERELRDAEVRRERKRAREELRKAYRELELRVKERTAELAGTNEELQHEIVEHKRTEESLRESQAKYESLVEQARDGVFIVRDQVVVFANQALADISGYTVNELAGKQISDLIAPESLADLMSLYFQSVAGGAVPDYYEARGISKSGTIKEIELSAKLIQFEGKPAVTGIVRDITESKRIQEEVFRGHKLESIGVLAGGIAHDFNNLLLGVLGNIALAKISQKLEPHTLDMLNQVEKAALRAKHLTNQLLTFSQGGAPVKRVVRIEELIRDMATFALGGSNVRCNFSISEDLWPVNVDEGQLGQVIYNLTLNAQQAMPQGGDMDIEVQNAIVDEEHAGSPLEGRYVRISVRDHGIGIPEEHIPRIFDPYFTTKQTGRGLGLSVAHAVVTKHGGCVEVESKLGTGAIFRIYLPAAEKQMPRSEKGNAGPKKKDTELTGKGRILLMDDQDIVRRVGREILEHFGYKAGLAKNGDEVLELYVEARKGPEPFDAVILDLTVPGHPGGKETIRRLLEIDPKVKGIVSTGYTNDPIVTEYRKHGFCGVINKPYDIEQLMKVLCEVINESDGS
ncbi:MAG: response regulator [Pseudomonadota bacterium]